MKSPNLKLLLSLIYFVCAILTVHLGFNIVGVMNGVIAGAFYVSWTHTTSKKDLLFSLKNLRTGIKHRLKGPDRDIFIGLIDDIIDREQKK